MNFIWILKLGAWFTETALPFLQKYWKQILIIGLIFIAFNCFTRHCGSERKYSHNSSGPDTLSVVIDTTFSYDSLRVHSLIASAIEDYKQKNPVPKWTPVSVNLENARTKQDSLNEFKAALEWAITQLEDCDSTYREDMAVRTYIDTSRTDSLEVVSTIVTQGKVLKEPRFDVRLLYGMPTVNKTVSLIDTVYIGPYRSIYLEGGAGPEFATPTDFIGFRAKVGAGYMDKKYWSYGAEGQYSTQNQWVIMGVIRKNFTLKRW